MDFLLLWIYVAVGWFIIAAVISMFSRMSFCDKSSTFWARSALLSPLWPLQLLGAIGAVFYVLWLSADFSSKDEKKI